MKKFILFVLLLTITDHNVFANIRSIQVNITNLSSVPLNNISKPPDNTTNHFPSLQNEVENSSRRIFTGLFGIIGNIFSTMLQKPINFFPGQSQPTTKRPDISINQTTTTSVSTTLVPTTLSPTTISPTTLVPTTVVPTTLVPTTVVPTTLDPTTLVPTTLVPTTLAPTTLSPTTLFPTTLVPTTVVPTTLVPTTVVPTTLVPTTLVPTTLVPTTLVPTTLVPTTLVPTTLVPTTLAPTTLVSTTLAPTTSPSTTLASTTLFPITTALPGTVAETCNRHNNLIIIVFAPKSSFPASLGYHEAKLEFASRLAVAWRKNPLNGVSLYVYARHVQLIFTLEESKNLHENVMRQLILSAPSIDVGTAATNDALVKAILQFHDYTGPGVLKSMVILTNGQTEDLINTQILSRRMQEIGIRVAAFGIGRTLIDNVLSMLSGYKENWKFISREANTILPMLQKISQTLCSN